ncbi:hypothetical protein [Noviherbaspirillum saxi]|nr:hypothetical protein [Noviherbaspirillum saxi]
MTTSTRIDAFQSVRLVPPSMDCTPSISLPSPAAQHLHALALAKTCAMHMSMTEWRMPAAAGAATVTAQ